MKVKSIEQQALQGLHRTRSLWMATRTSRINALRGFCREFGIVIAQGARLGRLHATAHHSRRCLLGRISKRGDRYLRMLLTHGARSVLHAAARATIAGKQVDGLRQWALGVQQRSNHNKAARALANKLTRICYATLRDAQPYGEPLRRPNKKIERASFALAA